MKNIFSIIMLLFIVPTFGASINKPVSLPYGFIENKGQIIDQNNNLNPAVKYLFNSNGLNVQLKSNGFSYDTYTIEKISLTKPKSENPSTNKFKMPDEKIIYHFHRVDIEFIGANKNPQIISDEPSIDYTNYYTTGTPEEGITNVRTFQKVTYQNIYDGIDLQFAVADNKPKYNFIIHPNADVSQIRWKYLGAFSTSSTDEKIILQLAQGNLEEKIPESFLQETNEKVFVNYISFGKDEFGFSASSFNINSTLVIDPWATYFGGTSDDYSYDITKDSSGNIIITGYTGSTSGIATSGAFQATYGGAGTYIGDAFVTKFNANGNRLWATYYGGTGDEQGEGITTDASSNIFITGYTTSYSGLATSGAFQTFRSGSCSAFIAKFSPSGSRLWATYFGGTNSDGANTITLDVSGNIFIAGSTQSNYGLATSGVYQTTFYGGSVGTFGDAFIAKFSSSGSRLWCTYYGGTGEDVIWSITTDSIGNIIVTGESTSTSLIASSGAYQTSCGGSYDAFIAKFNTNGSRIWATYYGGNYGDGGLGISLDSIGNIFITGYTSSSSGISYGSAYQYTFGGNSDAFIAKFSSSGNILMGTYFGGSNGDSGHGIKTDAAGNFFITGGTTSTSGIASYTSGLYQNYLGGNQDAFIAYFVSSGTLLWATYYGGANSDYGNSITANSSGNFYITGYTNSSSCIATSGAYQSAFSGGKDAFIASFGMWGVLPVNGISFDAKLQDKDKVFCTWATASEVNNDFFQIEKSIDNSQWIIAGKAKGHGTSNIKNNYQFTDVFPLKAGFDRTTILYYRLKQVDFDGKYSYSDVRIVNLNTIKNDDIIFPNPGSSKIFISGETQNRNIILYDMQGRELVNTNDNQLSNGIDVSVLSDGIYFYKITEINTGSIKTGKWLKE